MQLAEPPTNTDSSVFIRILKPITGEKLKNMVATSFKSHEICRISTSFVLLQYCLHIVIVNTLYLV